MKGHQMRRPTDKRCWTSAKGIPLGSCLGPVPYFGSNPLHNQFFCRLLNLHKSHRPLRGLPRQLKEGVLGVTKLLLRNRMMSKPELQNEFDRWPIELGGLAGHDQP